MSPLAFIQPSALRRSHAFGAVGLVLAIEGQLRGIELRQT